MISYMLNIKYKTNELPYETETDSQMQKANLWLLKGEEINQEFRINIYTPLFVNR